MFVCDASQTNKHIHILLGGEDGLFMLEIADTGAHHLGGKKVGHIEDAKEKDTVVYLGGGPCMCT